MVFSSHVFLYYFLPLALAAYFFSPRKVWLGVLAVFSYLFYGWANPAFMVLMLFSTLVDFFAGLVLESEARRRKLAHLPGRTPGENAALTASVLTNLGLLGFFKYFNFAADNYRNALQWLGMDAPPADFFIEVTLPLGISFYTFQSMSYTIDVFRGQARPIRRFWDFACYVSMFPQLVAGPIVRFQTMEYQLRRPGRNLANFSRGVACFALGLGKKVLIANPCGKVADVLFDAAGASALDAWFGLAAYSFQIYFDFSGYSDMAIGLGLMLGFVFPINFNSPYQAVSITDFWRRWHISLSTWLRDYLYIPLGGNRLGPSRTYANLIIVMFLGGLWHGASWNFVLWGCAHGALLAVERFVPGRCLWAFLPGPLRVAGTFLVVSLAWVLFRAPDLPSALAYYGALAGLSAEGPAHSLLGGIIYQPLYPVTMAMAALLVWTSPTTVRFTRILTWPKALWALLVFWLACAVLSLQSFNPFIYFIF